MCAEMTPGRAYRRRPEIRHGTLTRPHDSRREAIVASPRTSTLWPVAPRARRMPSIVAQSTPPARAADFRFVANFGDRRSAGGVGSGSGELSHTGAELSRA